MAQKVHVAEVDIENSELRRTVAELTRANIEMAAERVRWERRSVWRPW